MTVKQLKAILDNVPDGAAEDIQVEIIPWNIYGAVLATYSEGTEKKQQLVIGRDAVVLTWNCDLVDLVDQALDHYTASRDA